MKQPGVLQAFLFILAFVVGGFIIYQIEEYRLAKKEEQVISIVKEKAILEYKYLDTLKTVRGYLTTLVSNSNKRIDSLTAITEREQKERVIIRMIKPEILTSEELLQRFEKRYKRK